MKKVRRMKRILALLIAFLVVLTGLYFGYKYLFKAEDPKNNTKEDDKKDPEPVVVVPKLKIVDIDSNSRSIAVMINNHNAARPNHAGLQDAYMVYEMIVEGGITRMMAVYKDQDTAKIGSVRSARHYYLDYALESDAIYVHFGWSPTAQNDISSLRINNINGLYDSIFWRDTTLHVPYEHTAFTNIEKISSMVTKKGYRATTTQPLLLKYSISELDISTLEGAIIANNVSIPYSTYMTSSYVYDAVAKVYKRFANGVAHTDAITKLQYTVKNIITYKVTNSRIDSYGSQTLSNIGSGTGYYITDGYAAPITWTKSSRGSQTVYKYLNGAKIVVNDGNTFIQIQPSIQGLTIK